MKKLKTNRKLVSIILVFLILIILFLLWLNKKFTITFNDGGNVFTEIGNIKRWDVLEEPINPEKEGHIFAGWYMDDEKFDFSEKISKNMDLEAKWYKNEYKITIKTNNDKKTQTIKFDEKIEEPKSPKKQGYTFVGWYMDGKKYDFDSLVKEEIILEAKFKANTNTKYKVEHYLMDLNGKYTILKDTETKEGKTDSIVKPLPKTYEGFKTPIIEELKIKSDGSSVLKYYYERKKFSLDLIGVEGIKTVLGTGIYYYDENIEINTALFEGYSFDKWINDDVEYKESKVIINIKNNTNLNAKTYRNIYVVEFDSNKGSKVDSQIVLYKDKLVTPDNPTRTGYTFKGWYIDKELTREFDFNSVMPHENITLYAKWDANKYTFTFDANLGTGQMKEQGFIYDEESKLNNNLFTRAGYTFIGWSEEKNGKVIYVNNDSVLNALSEGNKTLYAKWVAKLDTSYVVKHYLMDLDGNYTILDSTDKLKGETDTKVTPTTKMYEGFAAPQEQEVNINGDGTTEVIYNYSRNQYDLVLNKGYGIKNVIGADTYYYDEEIIIDAEALPGYTFSEWEDVSTNKKYTFNMPAEDVTLEAIATLNEYSITYDYKGGSVSTENPSTYTVETPTFTLNEPTRVGYTFKGWLVNGESHNGTIRTGTIGDIEFVATWDANTYSVKYNGNGATSGSMENSFHTYDEEKVLSENMYERKYTVSYNLNYTTNEIISSNEVEYTFVGWNDPISGENYTNKQSVLNLTAEDNLIVNLYAEWESGSVELVEPERVGYTFKGWYKESDCINKVDDTYIPTSDITLYAKWEAKTDTPYTVKHYLMDLEGNFTILDGVDNLTGTTDSTVNPSTNTYEGFTAPEEQEVNINGDGTTEVIYNYSRNKYNLELNNSEGVASLSGSGSYYYNSNVEISAVLEEGYSFSKWVLNNDLYSINNIINVNLENNMSLQAFAKRNTYIVKFNTNYGSLIEEQSVIYKDKVIRPNDPIRNGYTFVGWYTDSSLNNAYDFNTSMPYNDIILYAKWDINSYTIGFNSNGGSSVASIIQEYGTVVNAPENPIRSGYDFAGWYTDLTFTEKYVFNTMPENGIEVHAKWIARDDTPYVVKHYLMDLEGNYTILDSIDYLKGTTDTLVTPNVNTYEGFTSPIKVEVNINGDGSTEVIYKYSRNKYILTLNKGYGIKNVVGSGSYYFDEEVQVSAASLNGYTFDKWSTGNTNTSYTFNMPANDINLEAVATINEYSISYNYKGGSDATNPSKYTVETNTFTLNEPLRVGYTFDGWIINGNRHSGEIVKETIGDMSVVATWKANKYSVKYNGNGATNGSMELSNHTYDKENELKENIFERKYTISYELNYVTNENVSSDIINYLFKGWSKTSSGTKLFDDKQSVINLTSEDNLIVNLYAVWEEQSILLAEPIRVGYTFKGWFKESECINKVDDNYIPTSDITLYAKWEINKYNVFLSMGKGIKNVIGYGEYDYNSEVHVSAEVLDGYTFSKWSNGILDNPYMFNMLANDINLEAVATINEYSISYNYKGGSDATNPSKYTVETNTFILNEPLRVGYTFDGWIINGNRHSGEIVKGTIGDMSVVATWKANTDTSYVVKHYLMDLDGNYTILEDIDYLKGTTDTLVTPNVNTYEGFASPTGIEVNINGDGSTEVVYKYSRNKYTLTLNSGNSVSDITGNGFSSLTGAGNYYHGDKISVSVVVKLGYTYHGWSNGVIDKEFKYTVPIKDETLIAIITLDVYDISYNYNGGSADNPINYTVETDSFVLNKPSKVGYTFDYFEINGIKSDGIINKGSVGNINVNAFYKPNTYTVHYNGNGATNGSMVDSNFVYDVDSKLSENKFSRVHTVSFDSNYKNGSSLENKTITFEFVGWTTSSSGTKLYDNNQVVSNLSFINDDIVNLYAKWDSVGITLPKLQRDEYEFVGWSEEKDSDVIVSSDNYIPDDDVTLYAVWAVIPKIESLSFKVYSDRNGTNYDYDHAVGAGDNAFYVKLPNDGYLDKNSMSVTFNTPIELNTEATAVDGSLDIIASDYSVNSKTSELTGELNLLNQPVEIKSSDGVYWYGTGNIDPLDMKTEFLQVIGEKTISIAKNIAKNNKYPQAMSPRYISTRTNVEGYTFMFFGIEGSGYIAITFKIGDYTLHTVTVPKGSLAPNFGEYEVGLHNFNRWMDKDGNTFDFDKPLYSNTIIYGDYSVEDIANTSWLDEYSGTATDPYLIKDRKDLLGFAALSGIGNTFKGKTLKIVNDIDMSGYNWVPIPLFTGTLLGDEHTIFNLTIDTSKQYAGMFSKLSGAKISGLKFDNLNISAVTSSGTGSIAGETDSSTIIEKVLINNATINGQNNVGGIVGIAKNSTIDQCAVTGSKIIANATDAGGIVAQGGGTLTMTNLYVDSTISCDETGVPDIGGILGDYDSSTNKLIMKHVLFTGEIDAGWIISFSTGPVYGRIGSGGSGDNSYNNDSEGNKGTWLYNVDTLGLSTLDKLLARNKLTRGTQKSTSELKKTSTYSGWDTSIWNISNGSYATLSWLS